MDDQPKLKNHIKVKSYNRARLSKARKENVLGMLNIMYEIVREVIKVTEYGIVVKINFSGADNRKYKTKWTYFVSMCSRCRLNVYIVEVRLKCGAEWYKVTHVFEAYEYVKMQFIKEDYASDIIPVGMPELSVDHWYDHVVRVCGGCLSDIDHEWIHCAEVADPCLFCMEVGADIRCVHCTDGDCGKSHHAMHHECMVKYLDFDKTDCPACRQPLLE